MDYILKFDSATNLYCTSYSSNYSECQWGTLSNPNLVTWDSQAAVNAAAAAINSGTVGVPRPQ